MTNKLLNLRNVPGDELDEIYNLLESQGIDYYETGAGTFGISLPALWVRDTVQYEQAQRLLAQYAVERANSAREQLDAELQAGKERTLVTIFKEHPLRFIGYLVLVTALLYLSTVQFWFSLR